MTTPQRRAQGASKIHIIPTLANPEAPTVAEVNAGVEVQADITTRSAWNRAVVRIATTTTLTYDQAEEALLGLFRAFRAAQQAIEDASVALQAATQDRTRRGRTAQRSPYGPQGRR